MRISVFGLGYVGTVSAACFSSRGHTAIGVDVSPTKVDLINSGRAPIVERDIETIVNDSVAAGRLSATLDGAAAVAATSLSIVCVGTPSAPNGAIDTRTLVAVCGEIGKAIGDKSERHVVVIRSTILPGTFRKLIVPALEQASGKRAGQDFGVVVNPEFLREGSAVSDFRSPPKTVIGADDGATAEIVESLYSGLPGPVVRTTPEVAEFVKYVDNPWHALKVAFANEIGNLCKASGVDSHAVMDIFLLDRKLNISPAYLKPGFAFGGSCLPKDLRAVTNFGRALNLDLPVLEAVLRSNAIQIERAADWVLSTGKRRVAILGCSFKAGTDDMRESPFIVLTERLVGKGCRVKIFDQNVRLSMVMGTNRDYVMATLPHIASLLVPTAAEAVDDAEVVLLTASSPEYLAAVQNLRDDQHLMDFARVDLCRQLQDRYDGVNW